MIMNLLILLLILATLVSFVDTTLIVLLDSPSPDSNCRVEVAEILTELYRQPDPRSNQNVIVAGHRNQHPYKSLELGLLHGARSQYPSKRESTSCII